MYSMRTESFWQPGFGLPRTSEWRLWSRNSTVSFWQKLPVAMVSPQHQIGIGEDRNQVNSRKLVIFHRVLTLMSIREVRDNEISIFEKEIEKAFDPIYGVL